MNLSKWNEHKGFKQKYKNIASRKSYSITEMSSHKQANSLRVDRNNPVECQLFFLNRNENGSTESMNVWKYLE